MQALYKQILLVPFHFTFFLSPSLCFPFSFQISLGHLHLCQTQDKKECLPGEV